MRRQSDAGDEHQADEDAGDVTPGLDLLDSVDPYSLPGNVDVIDDFYLLTQLVILTVKWSKILIENFNPLKIN